MQPANTHKVYLFIIGIIVIAFTAVSAVSISGRYARTVMVIVDDSRPCPGADVTYSLALTEFGPNLRYQWRVNGVPRINSNNATFTVPGNTEPIKPSDAVDCIVTDVDANVSVTSPPRTGIEYLLRVPANVSIYFITNTTEYSTATYCEGSTVDIGSAASIYYDGAQTKYMFYNDPNTRYSYRWMVNGNPVGVDYGALTTNDLKDGDKITCMVKFTSKCGSIEVLSDNTLTVRIISPPSPTVNISSGSGDKCFDPKAVYTAAVSNGGNMPVYQWTVNDANVGGNSSTYSNPNLKVGDVVKCSHTSLNNCGKTTIKSNEIVIAGTPLQSNSIAITSSVPNNLIQEGQPITFTAEAAYTNNITYQWYVNGQEAGTNSATFTASNLTLGDKVNCRVTTADDCVLPQTATSNQIIVLMIKPIIIPNTFTPNGDGINDKWNIPALLAYPNCRIDIFNRYGAPVYHSVGYTDGWDGTMNGSQLPAGVYYYIIQADNTTPRLSGALNILR
ncbi:gliding motility-associated C-terminal domain-containing protein [Mucilaginibacter sp. JRF]|uniref:gliding motility-associated C-terminal domain-containing protein n=1 Tax=Mucilaginibacter sp. JRF TaxID=2780088 RepID=UPI0018828648|nr:gliding motility-associated C-terminal domain-containing protein [Mucilaginibacter sp. JRF]MBE9586924.1 gliding motility-associated C-terminal domain-containing protein [Mucilaginibacter sp. JRF]